MDKPVKRMTDQELEEQWDNVSRQIRELQRQSKDIPQTANQPGRSDMTFVSELMALEARQNEILDEQVRRGNRR